MLIFSCCEKNTQFFSFFFLFFLHFLCTTRGCFIYDVLCEGVKGKNAEKKSQKSDKKNLKSMNESHVLTSFFFCVFLLFFQPHNSRFQKRIYVLYFSTETTAKKNRRVSEKTEQKKNIFFTTTPMLLLNWIFFFISFSI